jgi:ABC-2 type transport system permease protein
MLRALKAEVLKLRRARMVMWTALSVALVPAVVASSLKLSNTDLGRTTWESFMDFAPQMMASWWGVLLFGLAASYLFGREYADGTAKTMLTLPIRRESFVAAKMIVLAAWVFGLTALSVVLEAACAAVLRLPGFAWEHVWATAGESMTIALLVYLTLPVVAWLAMLEKGYLPPMLFSAFMATAGFMCGAIGWGRWFPWSMPLAVAGSAFGPLIQKPTLVAGSWVVEVVVFSIGLAAVIAYIDRADNTQ